MREDGRWMDGDNGVVTHGAISPIGRELRRIGKEASNQTPRTTTAADFYELALIEIHPMAPHFS